MFEVFEGHEIKKILNYLGDQDWSKGVRFDVNFINSCPVQDGFKLSHMMYFLEKEGVVRHEVIREDYPILVYYKTEKSRA